MQATNLVSVEEYDHMTFEHDAEYVLGRIVHRPAPQFPHARLQATLSSLFYTHEREWALITVTEQRVRIAPGVFRIPDICLLRDAPETGNVTSRP
ncbi:MAG: Uma2 family endonuclease [Bryobacteraceae bacterium]